LCQQRVRDAAAPPQKSPSEWTGFRMTFNARGGYPKSGVTITLR
jgi:hypothetical protein